MENANASNILDMHLNSRDHSDKKFNNSIKFVVEKYIQDDIPQQIQCDNMHMAIYEAYKLFLTNDLHSIGLIDAKNNYNGTDALNYFTDNIYNTQQQNKITEIEKELQAYKSFIKLYNIDEQFEEYKKTI